MNLFKKKSADPKGKIPPFYLSPSESGQSWHRVTEETTVSIILQTLGAPSEQWDDEVDCSLQYKTQFGELEFMCESVITHGADKARLKYIEANPNWKMSKEQKAPNQNIEHTR